MTRTIDLTEPSPRRRWPQIFGVWTAAVFIYAIALQNQANLPFQYALVTGAVYYYSLAALMIPVSRWSASLQKKRLSTMAVIVRHHVSGILVIALWQILNLVYARAVIGTGFWDVAFAGTWIFQLLTAVMTYGTALSLTLLLQASDRERERERREAELLLVARDSELASIKAQMQPHFVLNVLNSLLVLIEKDPALAKTMVSRLSDLIRAVFEQSEVEQISLRREIELVKAYLEIERIRFGPRLATSIDVQDGLDTAIVPAFLLQPIVENAIKHGIALQTGPGELKITVTRDANRLSLIVMNTRRPGPAPDIDSSSHTGRGLSLTRRRLAATYGDDHHLTFDAGASTVRVKLDLPAYTYEHETTATIAR
jgi:two-component system LytT family sensor kinase